MAPSPLRETFQQPQPARKSLLSKSLYILNRYLLENMPWRAEHDPECDCHEEESGDFPCVTHLYRCITRRTIYTGPTSARVRISDRTFFDMVNAGAKTFRFKLARKFGPASIEFKRELQTSYGTENVPHQFAVRFTPISACIPSEDFLGKLEVVWETNKLRSPTLQILREAHRVNARTGRVSPFETDHPFLHSL